MGSHENREEGWCDEGDVQQSFGGQVDHCWTNEHFRVSVGDVAQDTMCLRLDFQVVSSVVLWSQSLGC